MIKLQKVTTWQEKSDQFTDGTLRVYIGGLLTGRAIPRIASDNNEQFRFDSLFEDIIKSTSNKKWKSIEEITTDVELSFKSLVKVIAKSTIREDINRFADWQLDEEFHVVHDNVGKVWSTKMQGGGNYTSKQLVNKYFTRKKK